MIIRLAKESDLETLVELEDQCFSHYQLNRRSMRRFLKGTNSEVLVLEKDFKVCGHVVVLFRKNSSQARIYSIAVDPRYRKLNCGSKLLEETEKVIRQKGMDSVILEVSMENNVAIKFYKKHGYQDKEVFHDYYEDGHHAHRMFKKI